MTQGGIYRIGLMTAALALGLGPNIAGSATVESTLGITATVQNTCEFVNTPSLAFTGLTGLGTATPSKSVQIEYRCTAGVQPSLYHGTMSQTYKRNGFFYLHKEPDSIQMALLLGAEEAPLSDSTNPYQLTAASGFAESITLQAVLAVGEGISGGAYSANIPLVLSYSQ